MCQSTFSYHDQDNLFLDNFNDIHINDLIDTFHPIYFRKKEEHIIMTIYFCRNGAKTHRCRN